MNSILYLLPAFIQFLSHTRYIYELKEVNVHDEERSH